MEETVYDPHDYRVLNANNIDYKMRMFNEVPHHSDLVLESCKSADSPYPFGANGIGEPTIAPGGPAITMALYNACGIMLESYPYTPGQDPGGAQRKGGERVMRYHDYVAPESLEEASSSCRRTARSSAPAPPTSSAS